MGMLIGNNYGKNEIAVVSTLVACIEFSTA